MIQVRLEEVLKKRGLTMYELAKRTPLAQSTISNFNAAKTTKVSYELLDILCEFLDCQPGDLLVHIKKDKSGER